MCSCRGASGFAHVSCLARQAEVAVERRRRHVERIALRVFGGTHPITAGIGKALRKAWAALARRIARRVLGGTYPTTAGIEKALRKAWAALRARETPSES